MILAFLLGAFLVLAQMTQLRGDEPIGILDLLLVAGALAAAGSTFIKPKSLVGESLGGGEDSSLKIYFRSPVFIYAIWSILAIGASTVINSQSGLYPLASFFVPAAPFIATSLVTICLVIVVEGDEGDSLLAGFAFASLLLGIIYTFGALTSNAAMMYEDRFSGLSANPNQVALQALATLVALAMVIMHTRSNITFYIAAAATPFTLAYGLASKSDAFMICLPVATAVFGLIVLKRYQIKLWLVIVAGTFLSLAFLLSLAAAFPHIFGGVGGLIESQLQQGGQDTDRTLLWRHGWMAWQHSPLFGNGPGAWSGLGAPFQGLEAHNSLIDWLSISGLFGFVPIALIIVQLFRKYDDVRLIRALGIAALAIFTAFHFVFRLPIFWFTVLLLLMPYYVQWQRVVENDAPEQ